MSIEWSKSLETGLDWQDRQHKELFRRINNLLEAMNLGLGKEEAVKLFKFLDDYFVIHFEAEEQAMNKYQYPSTLAHLNEHTMFIDEIGRLRGEFEKGTSSALVIQFQRKVVDWLINHIGVIDKELGRFLVMADSQRKGKI